MKQKNDSKKILIKIIQKNGIKSSRWINKSNKKFYNYNHSSKSYVRKSKIEISRIKFVKISKKKEKVKAKRVKKEIKVEKEKLVKRKIEKPLHEEILEKEGYEIYTYECLCKVSDRKINHLYGVKAELDNMVEELHEHDYSDHELIEIHFISSKRIKYGYKGYPRKVTSKQIKFMKQLGLSDVEIGTIKTKKEASQTIDKLNR